MDKVIVANSNSFSELVNKQYSLAMILTGILVLVASLVLGLAVFGIARNIVNRVKRIDGLSTSLASKDLTEYGVNASDLINYMPKAIKTLMN